MKFTFSGPSLLPYIQAAAACLFTISCAFIIFHTDILLYSVGSIFLLSSFNIEEKAPLPQGRGIIISSR